MKHNKTLFATISLIGLFHIFCFFAQAQTEADGTIDRSTIETYGCLSGATKGSSKTDKVYVKTGWKTLDDSLIKDITELDTKFGVNVQVYFVKADEDNAFFTAKKFPDLMLKDNTDPNTNITGSVFIFSGLLTQEFQNGGYAIPATLAHEFAHAAQYANNFPYSGKYPELHADYLAGWFTAHRGRTFPQDQNAALLSFYKRGDFAFFDKDHHGTPQERANAFIAGYNLNVKNSVSDGGIAYNSGLQYIKNL
jgi:hypothetical protein